MSRWLEGLEDRLSSVAGLGPRLDAMIMALQDLGFTSLGYDYTPVPDGVTQARAYIERALGMRAKRHR